MIINKLLDRVNRESKKKARIQKAIKFATVLGVAAAIGSGIITGIVCSSKYGKEKRNKIMEKAADIAEDFKDKILQNVKTVKDIIFHAEKETTEIIEGIYEKKEDIKDDLRDGSKKVAEAINETADSVSKNLKSE